MNLDELAALLAEGDPQSVFDLIEPGVGIRYKRQYGYDALLDTLDRQAKTPDPKLLEILVLLVKHEAALTGVSSYAERALNSFSLHGRFDAVRLLLDAGADKKVLRWTPLMEAIALGSYAEVEDALARGESLEARDCWSRTPWLLALMTGDLSKAKRLLEHGADPDPGGLVGEGPLYYAIQAHCPEMLGWLIQEGADPNQTDGNGETALMYAAAEDDVECVEVLLAAGADVKVNARGTALMRAASRGIMLRLIEAGADPAELEFEGQRILLGFPPASVDALAAVSPEEFSRASTRTFGKSNPERMSVPFWEAMIRSGVSADQASEYFKGARHEWPIWCAERFGQTLTLLPDGRVVQIGGEHEDGWDINFCIYNDVFVYGPEGSVTIYGYPEAVFPPTDFHTATLIDDFIYLIGSLGYSETRQYGQTPVYRLNIQTFSMEALSSSGESPGWIHRHQAVAVNAHEIRIQDGSLALEKDGEKWVGTNFDAYVLELNGLQWRKTASDSNREGSPGG